MTPLLLFIVTGIVESGRLFLAYVQLSNAVREGARGGAFIPQDTAEIDTLTRRELPSWVTTSIINVSVSCAPAASTVFDDCVTSYPPTSGDKVKVEVSYAYQPIMPVVNELVSFMSLTLSTNAVMRVQ